MPSQPKRKPLTRSVQQILAENEATVKFYRNMSMTTAGLYNILIFFLFREMSSLAMTMNVMVSFMNIVCYHLMRYISTPVYSAETLQLVDPGHDLNMAGGLGEFFKDIMIISSVTHLMALFSNKFWLTLLIIPLRGFWLVWVGVLTPWYAYDESEEVDEEEERKHKKADKIKETS